MRVERLLPSRLTTVPGAKYTFGAVVVLVLGIAVGQWYLFDLLTGLSSVDSVTTLYLGVPLWLWLQLGLVAVMLVLAWVAVSVWTTANRGADRGVE